MGGIAGVIRFDRAPGEQRYLDAIVAAAAHRGNAWWWAGPLTDLAQIGRPEGSSESESRIVVVADARIDNRIALVAELRERLGTNEPSDTELIEAAYQQWGPDCATHIIGDFAFAVWDGNQRRLIAARDPMGMRPLYYRIGRSLLIFASEVKQILAHPDVAAEPNEAAIAAYLVGPFVPPEWSFYAGIDQLAPGHTLIADTTGHRIRRHWEPDPERRVRYRHREEYADELGAHLDEAVRCRTRDAGLVGISLSGGLDSGLVASMLGRSLRDKQAGAQGAVAFTWAFDELRDADERSISSLITDHYGLRTKDVPGDDAWPLKDYEDHGPDRDDPQIKPYQELNDRTLAAAAAEGVDVLLSGDRGDELVGDWVFDFPGLLRSGRILPMVADLFARARDTETTVAHQVKQQLLRPLVESATRIPIASRFVPSAFTTRRDRSRRSYPAWIPTDFARRTNLEDLLAEAHAEPTFSGHARRARYGRIFARSGVRRATVTERDYATHGIVYADPWSDRRVAEFILAVPQWIVQAPRHPKALARDAGVGVMPDGARRASRKTTPQALFDRGVRDRGRTTVLALLTDSIAEQRGYLDAAAVRTNYEDYRAGRPITWDFWWPLTLEMWLRRWWA